MIISVDFASDMPIYCQIRDQIVVGIASGALQPGEELPSVRRLAADIGINIHTANKAYALLRDDGYLHMNRRTGATISASAPRDHAFQATLAERIRPLAAEARCHGMDDAQFGEFCSSILRRIMNEIPTAEAADKEK